MMPIKRPDPPSQVHAQSAAHDDSPATDSDDSDSGDRQRQTHGPTAAASATSESATKTSKLARTTHTIEERSRVASILTLAKKLAWAISHDQEETLDVMDVSPSRCDDGLANGRPLIELALQWLRVRYDQFAETPQPPARTAVNPTRVVRRRLKKLKNAAGMGTAPPPSQSSSSSPSDEDASADELLAHATSSTRSSAATKVCTARMSTCGKH